MEDGGYRTNQRLQCFFKRHLGQRVCDALRISEPCIVVGESFGHAFKFIALTDSKLFILANPPQTEQDIELTIELQNIAEINDVHDIPDFLSGDLQKSAQHFAVKYLKQANAKLQNISSSSSLPLSQRSSQSISGDRKSDSSITKRRPGTFAANRIVSPSQTSDDSRYLTSSTVFEESVEGIRRSKIQFKSDHDTMHKTRDRSFSDPLNVADLSPGEDSSILSHSSLHQNVPNSYSIPSFGNKVGPCSSQFRPLPPPAPGTENTNASNIMNSPKLRVSGRRQRNNEQRRSKDFALKWNASEPHLEKYTYSQRTLSTHNTHHRIEHTLDKALESSLLHNMPKEDSNANKFLPSSSSHSLSSSFSAKVVGFFGKADEKSPEKEQPVYSIEEIDDEVLEIAKNETTLDIYLINGESPLISLLRATRINSIIAHTLEQSISKEKSLSSASSKIMEEFYQLKEEIFNCNKIENAFIFAKELVAGCKKRPFIKKLFWKTDELLNYYTALLDEYLSNHGKIKMRGDEADQLDFMLIIVELIIAMIFNTEILPSRNKILFGHRGSIVVNMLKIALVRPTILKKKESQQLSTAASLLLSGVETQLVPSEKELELNYLLGEWTDICSSLIYELLNAAEQCSWTYRDGKGISVHKLIEIMDHHSCIEQFLDDMIQRILERMTEDKLTLKRPDVVLLFKQFSVLHFVFENSSRLSRYLAEKYYEEFRYYMGSPEFLSKIPDCPLFSILTTVINNVILLAINC